MWWDPQRSDFICPDMGKTLIHGLGRLKFSKLGDLLKACIAADDKYTEYTKLIAPDKPHPLFFSLAAQMNTSLERLKTLPLPWTTMVSVVTHLQRAYLEFVALLKYMKVYKPRMETACSTPPSSLEPCVGAFISDALVAQRFHAAGLAYWLIRETFAFRDENILEIVELTEPIGLLELEPLEGFVPIHTGPGTFAKIEAMRAARRSGPLYSDPFELSGSSVAATSSAGAAASSSSTAASLSAVAGSSGGSRAGGRGTGGAQGAKKDNRHQPYGPPRSPNKAEATDKGGRNKYQLLRCTEMPASVTVFERGLAEVDTTRTVKAPGVGGRYVFPEPALLVSSSDYERRQLMLHHYELLQDTLFFRLGESGEQRTISTQQWRDILTGKVAPRGRGKTGERSVQIASILAPTLKACGLDGYRDFPATCGSFAPIPINRAKEILWGIAESNFRFEFLGLDCRASGMCFAGDMVMGMPLEEGKRGLATLTSAERHQYFLRIAKLMEAWTPSPSGIIMQANTVGAHEWDSSKRDDLELAVGRHYTQTFFDYFGRAAVIPMRLEHEFGS
ncbi:hypothetical protein B0H16DRAFT_1697357 [Mycena metata]|uniref:Uncharacterized protein n=1 Tax=Mycena metata TaxID=1033252 RepID=A0AAD7HUT0_9AGAR|nr:hypothetical protein B0H16DRAFT_1697357 [Mycena metata]